MADLDRARAQRLMHEAGVDALVLFQPEHIAYAIGAGPGVATMWRRGGGAVAIVPADASQPVTALVGDVNAEAVAKAAPDIDIRAHRVWVDTVDLSGLDPTGQSTAEFVEAGYQRLYAGAPTSPRPTTFDYRAVLGLLSDTLGDRGLSHGRIAADLAFLPAADYVALVKALPDPAWSDGSSLILQLRAIKSPAEIDRLRRACALAEAGLDGLIAEIALGRTQRDLSHAWLAAVATAATDMPDLTGTWDYISVGADPWSGSGTVAPGSIIKADVGCLVGGYSSDTARTFVFGAPSRQAQDIFSVLEDAFETGIALIRPGARFADIYAATIGVIRAAGFPSYDRGHFGHSLGGDIGIEDWPFISADSNTIVEPNMVLAFEVPFYGKGVGALMIEEQFLVTSSGSETMNRLPRGLRRID